METIFAFAASTFIMIGLAYRFYPTQNSIFTKKRDTRFFFITAGLFLLGLLFFTQAKGPERINLPLGMPSAEILSNFEPRTYQRIIHDQLKYGETNPSLAILKTSKILNNLVAKRILKASDEAILRYTRVFLKELAYFQLTNHLCQSFLFPQSDEDTQKVAASLTQAPVSLVNEKTRALNQIITSFDEDREQPDDENIQSFLDQVLSPLVNQYEKEIPQLRHPTKAADQMRMCQLVEAIYHQALSLPNPDKANFLRYLFSQQKTSPEHSR